MKIGRVLWNGAPRLARIDEPQQSALRVEGELANHPNPVLAVIERGLSAEQLMALGTTPVPLAGLALLAPLSALVRNVFALVRLLTHEGSAEARREAGFE